MKTYLNICFSLLFVFVIHQNSIAQSYPIYTGQTLNQGYDMAVNTNNNRTDWLHDMIGYMKADYPANQQWGFVMITYGASSLIQSQKLFRNFSNFTTLSVEMKGITGNEQVAIGIKDVTDPNNGSETKFTRTLTRNWKVFTFPLTSFTTADLYHLYVVIEFVFSGPNSETIFFKNVTYN